MLCQVQQQLVHWQHPRPVHRMQLSEVDTDAPYATLNSTCCGTSSLVYDILDGASVWVIGMASCACTAAKGYSETEMTAIEPVHCY